MSYLATVNNQLFLDTTLDSDNYTLISGNVRKQLNMAGTFSFVIPQSHVYYGEFRKLQSYIDLYRNQESDPYFFGRVYSVKRLFNGDEEIVCEGALAYLNDSIFDPITHDGTLFELVRKLLQSHNAQVEEAKWILPGNFYASDSACYRAYENYESTLSRLKDLVDSYGGYFTVRKTSGTMYLDYYDHCQIGSSQAIDFGENLLDLSVYHDASQIVTVLTPLGAADDDNVRVDISSVNRGSKELVASSEMLALYGHVHKSQIWDDVHEPSILAAKGLQYMNACLQPQYQLNVNAVDLTDAGYSVDKFDVGQRVKVTSVPHNLDGVWFDVTTVDIDLFAPESNTLLLGSTETGYIGASRINTQRLKTDLERIARLYVPRSQLTDAIDTATSLITGNSGGYIILHDSDGDGEPDELLVMDTPDIETAVRIWRFNSAGLGYSSTGYNGTYGLAMTMDGAIVADRITTGTLNGNLIRAGVIRGQQGNTYWDLNTGVLHIEGTGDIDKSKVFIYTPVPPYYVGDLWVTQRDDSSGVVGYMVAGYGIVGNSASGEGGKIMTCIYTRTSGDFDESDWSLITNYVSDNDLQILEQRVSAAELHIDANTASIQTKASVEVTDYLGNRIEAAESTISQQADEIELKVSEADVTGNYLIGKINLSSTSAIISAQRIDLQGAVTISSFDAATQGKVVIGSTSRNQYYLSTSASELVGGSWVNTIPSWASGKYIWTRIATTKTFADNSTSTSYSDGVYDSNLTTALVTANTAKNTANASLGSAVSVYYRSTTNSTPTINASSSIGTAVDTSNAWEYVLPRPKYGCYFYTCERYVNKEGTVSFSAVRQMANTTYTSLWCSAENATYIDGGHIYAYSVTASQLASNSVTAAKIAAEAVTAGKIATGAVTADKISVSDLAAVGAKIADFTISYSSISSGSMTVGSSTVYGAVLASNSPKLEFRQTFGGVSTYDKYVRVNGNGINFNMAKKGRTSWALSDTCFQIAYYENTSSGSMFPEFDLKLNGSYLWFIRPDDFEIFATSTLAHGALKATGTKSRLINTENYGERLLYCYESPTPMFGDVGEAVIDDTGEAYIWIDPIFEQTVSLNQYQVFLQRYGEGECYVSKKTSSYFAVKGTPGLSFGWELKAKQIDYDQLRLDKNDFEYSVPDEYLGTESANYVSQIFEGRYA